MSQHVNSTVSTSLLILSLLWATPGAAAADDPPNSAILHLKNKGTTEGKLCDSNDPTVLRWQSPHFVQPFEFPLGSINAINYPPAEPKPDEKRAYCLELSGNDLIYGDILRIGDEEIEVDAAQVGRVVLHREHVRRIYPIQGADSVYLGPSRMEEWKEVSSESHWRTEGGELVTDQTWAAIHSKFEIPPRALIEFALSWTKQPDFVLQLGVDPQKAAVKDRQRRRALGGAVRRVNQDSSITSRATFQIEVWDDKLVAVGEAKRDADVKLLQKLSSNAGQIRMQAFVDQEQGRLILLSPSGGRLADLKIRAKKPNIGKHIALISKNGAVRLKHLRITRWNGRPPVEVPEHVACIHRTDGTVINGRLTAYDPESKQFTVQDGESETSVPHSAVANVVLSRPGEATPDEESGSPRRTMRIACQYGSQFSGEPTRVESTHLTLACPGLKSPLRLPVADLRSLAAIGNELESSDVSPNGRIGRVELEGVTLKGRLADGMESTDSSCLSWHPELSLNASPMQLGVSGRIVYHEPPTPDNTGSNAAQVQIEVPAVVPVLARALRMSSTKSRKQSSTTEQIGWRELHLRTGDSIPCEVSGIDDKGVTFTTPVSDATFVTHGKVKAVEFVPTSALPVLGENKRDRLLTVPRLRKESPPTHLILAKNGDFLRGRLISMDSANLEIEVRLETLKVPRDRIGQIVWLHGDTLTNKPPTVTIDSGPGATRVQTIRGSNDRMTFVANKVENGTISGVSEILGNCRSNVGDVHQVLIGNSIEKSVSKLALHRWKLRDATEPKFVQADGDSPGSAHSSGTRSPLVGQSAFAFKLDLLNGGQFDLNKFKGKFVVIDFWATWCGPCVQSMPMIEAIIEEFAAAGVELIAVNMEEQPDQIKSMMERHDWKMPVALDRDGVVAAKFNVTAIPQTVIVDPEGKIARLYVGGGQDTADALRKALAELTAGKLRPTGSPSTGENQDSDHSR